MPKQIERLLGLRRGERGRALLLFLYLFLVISTYVAGKATRDALFLEQYKAAQLPYADILITLVVVPLVAAYARARRHVGLLTLLAGSLLFFSFNAFLLWFLVHEGKPAPWLPVVVYVWVGAVGVIGPAQVWMLANYVLTLREAKRLFGVIGSGAILGWIVGGLMTTTTARRFGAEDTLLIMGVALVACAAIVVAIWRRRPAALAQFADGGETLAGEDSPSTLSDSLKLVWSSPYLRAMALLVCLSSLTTGIVAWQFKAIAKQQIPGTNDLAAFFGSFNFYAGILALVAQVLLTRTVLRRFGVGVALFIVPVALLMGSAGLLVWGGLTAIVVLKGSDHVLRYSVDKSTLELLYMPLRPADTFHAKLCIDAIVWRAGDTLGSMVVLLAAGALGLAAVQVTPFNMLLISGWVAAAWIVHRRYVANLAESIARHRLDAERASAPVLERSMNDLIAAKLSAGDPQDVLYGMGLLEVSKRRTTHPAIRPLLRHPVPEVRARAVEVLSEAGDLSVGPIVEELLSDENVQVRTAALLYLAHHAPLDPVERLERIGDFEPFSVRSALVTFLARLEGKRHSEAAAVVLDRMVAEDGVDGSRTRQEAARVIGSLGGFEPQLSRLLDDPDPTVVQQAIRSAACTRPRNSVGRVIECLSNPELRPDAVDTLVQWGDRIAGTLRDHLVDQDVPMQARREIPEVLMRIGTSGARNALVETLICADTVLRFRIISALNKLQQAHPDEEIDLHVIETALVGEIMGHYRSYEILGTLGPPGKTEDPVTRGLRESMDHELERIFRLLQLRYPRQDIHSAYVGVQSKNPLAHDNALELLDHVLGPSLRGLLVPLIDSEVSVRERMEIAHRLLGRGLGNSEEAVAALIYSEDPWLKACAAYSIGMLGLRSFEAQLDRWLDDPDPLLRETARHSKLQLSRPGQVETP
jgi:AAA family ATP:ADP antiporter